MSAPRKNANGATKAQMNIIFKADAVAKRLSGLKAAAKEDDHWWKDALDFGWGTPSRKGNNGTFWQQVDYTDESGVRASLHVRINNERHIGMIMPKTDAGVAELTSSLKNAKVKIEKRTKKPTLQFQKWATEVKAAADGITLLTDANGNPIVPGDEFLSPYYTVMSLLHEAFITETKERLDRGAAFLAKVNEVRKTDKTATVQAVQDAFVAVNGPRLPGDMILASSNASDIRKFFPNAKDSETLLRNAIVVSNIKLANLIQENVSDQSAKNAGCLLPNPMTRVGLKFDDTTGAAQLEIFDKSKPYVVDGRTKYDKAMVDGVPVNDDNIHKFILSRSSIDGIINLGAVCYHNLGISMPVSAEILVVNMPSFRGVSLDDMEYDVDPGYVPADAAAAKPAPAAAAKPAPAAAAAKPAPAKAAAAKEDPPVNYDDLLDELSAK